MEKTDVLIIDGNNFCYRAYYRFKGFSNLDGAPTGVIFGFLQMLTGLVKHFKPRKIYVVFDGKKSKQRLKLHPDYKNRVKSLDFDAEGFYAQREYLIKTLPKLSLNVLHNIDYEADDIIYMVYKKYFGKKIVIASSDKDFNQLITKNTSVWDGKNQILLQKKTLKGRFGCRPEQVVDYLTLIGDDSDNIPGYRGMGEKRTQAFLEKYNSIAEYLESNDEIPSLDKTKLRQLYELNRCLIDLRYFYKKYVKILNQDDKLTKPKIKPTNELDKVKKMMMQWEINFLNKPENYNTLQQFIKQTK